MSCHEHVFSCLWLQAKVTTAAQKSGDCHLKLAGRSQEASPGRHLGCYKQPRVNLFWFVKPAVEMSPAWTMTAQMVSAEQERVAKHRACPMALAKPAPLRETDNVNSNRITVGAKQRWETTSDTWHQLSFRNLLICFFFCLFSLVCLPRHAQRCRNNCFWKCELRAKPLKNCVHSTRVKRGQHR